MMLIAAWIDGVAVIIVVDVSQPAVETINECAYYLVTEDSGTRVFIFG